MRRRQALKHLAEGMALAAGLTGPDLAGLDMTGLGVAGAQAPAAADDGLFDGEGYRRARYRAPIAFDPAPARRIALADALRLRPGRDALFIDALPVENGVRDPVTGRWTLAEAHQTIPAARWFPEIGHAPVDGVLWAGFMAAVHEVRGRHPRWPVVIFCRADCWMSWNAARRLARSGVQGVWWLAEGIDGWHDAMRALAPVTPETTPAPPPVHDTH